MDTTAQAKPHLLDTEQAATYLGLKRNTLEIWRCTGRNGLKFVKVGGLVRYRRTDLEAWLEARTRTQTGAVLSRAPSPSKPRLIRPR